MAGLAGRPVRESPRAAPRARLSFTLEREGISVAAKKKSAKPYRILEETKELSTAQLLARVWGTDREQLIRSLTEEAREIVSTDALQLPRSTNTSDWSPAQHVAWRRRLHAERLLVHSKPLERAIRKGATGLAAAHALFFGQAWEGLNATRDGYDYDAADDARYAMGLPGARSRWGNNESDWAQSREIVERLLRDAPRLTWKSACAAARSRLKNRFALRTIERWTSDIGDRLRPK
jgi:hypothetical protein